LKFQQNILMIHNKRDKFIRGLCCC